MKSGKLKIGLALLAASVLLPAAGNVLPAQAGTASASTIDPGKEVSLTVVNVRGAADESGQTGENDGTKGSGIAGNVFSVLKIADLKILGDENGCGMYYVPTESGEELIRLSREEGVEVKATLIGGTTAYTGPQMEDLIDRFCRSGTVEEGGSPAEGEERLTDFVRKQQKAIEFLPTDSEGKSSRQGMEQGLYLVARTGDKTKTVEPSGDDPAGGEDVVGKTVPREAALSEIRPFLVSLPMTGDAGDGSAVDEDWQYDVTVFPKQQLISIPKYIVSCEDKDTLLAREDVEIGEVFDQVILPEIPAAESWHAYEKYAVTDEMDPGMSLVRIKAVRLGKKTEATGKLSDLTAYTDLEEDVDYMVRDLQGEKNPEGSSGFCVTLLEKGLERINASAEDSRLEILYETVLNDKASDGSGAVMENHPALDWKVTGEQGNHIDGNRPAVCSYRLKVTKTGLQDPTKVTFSMQRKKDGSACRFKKESEGTWLILGEDTSEDMGELYVSPASDGTMTIRGLDDESYRLTECSTESGYELLSEPLEVELKSEDPADGNLSAASVHLGEENEIPVEVDKGTASFSIRNRRGVFPKMGGVGRFVFYLTTVTGMLLSGCLLGRRRKNYGR